MIELFDTHCHLTDAAFRDDREAVFVRARDAGVTRLVSIASTLDDAAAARELARSREGVWCTAGIHPHEAGDAPADAVARLREAAAHPEVVALGETGLDYHYDFAPRDVQRRLFAAHMEVAGETGLPVVVHSREADADVAAAMAGAPAGVVGVLHCFTGGPLAFERAMLMGWFVSFSGVASFRSFPAADMLREVPLDRLLLETDAPYLAPVPHRGKRNEPAHVTLVAAAVARHLGHDVASVARRTTENALRFYRLAGEPRGA